MKKYSVALKKGDKNCSKCNTEFYPVKFYSAYKTSYDDYSIEKKITTYSNIELREGGICINCKLKNTKLKVIIGFLLVLVSILQLFIFIKIIRPGILDSKWFEILINILPLYLVGTIFGSLYYLYNILIKKRFTRKFLFNMSINEKKLEVELSEEFCDIVLKDAILNEERFDLYGSGFLSLREYEELKKNK